MLFVVIINEYFIHSLIFSSLAKNHRAVQVGSSIDIRIIANEKAKTRDERRPLYRTQELKTMNIERKEILGQIRRYSHSFIRTDRSFPSLFLFLFVRQVGIQSLGFLRLALNDDKRLERLVKNFAFEIRVASSKPERP